MRLAPGCALLLLVALAATQPVQDDTTVADATPATTQAPPADNSGELPPPLVEVVMQLVLDLLRLAMELHHSGGSRLVTARRLNISDEPSLLITFHRSAEAAAALLTPEGQMRQLTSLAESNRVNSATADKREVVGRAMDYESSAEASLSDRLPFTIEPLPPPVVPHLVAISMPPDHTEESSPGAVTDKELSHEKAQGSHPAGERRQPKKAGEVAERAGEVSRTVVLMSDGEREDPYGLRFLMRFLEAIHKVVGVVKSLVGRLRGLRDGGSVDGGSLGGGGGSDVGSKHALKHALASTEDLADKVSGLMVAHEHVKGAKPRKQKASGGEGRPVPPRSEV